MAYPYTLLTLRIGGYTESFTVSKTMIREGQYKNKAVIHSKLYSSFVHNIRLCSVFGGHTILLHVQSSGWKVHYRKAVCYP